MKLAVVGSVRFTDPGAPQLALEIIRHKIRVFTPEVLISGGADGIDKLAEEAWRELVPDVEPTIHLPQSNRWAPYGYQDRNRLIATDCTHLLAIRDHHSKNNGWMDHPPYLTYGAGWTADEAQRMGKQVERIIL